MGRTCTVCALADVAALEAEALRGVPAPELAARYGPGVSDMSIGRHMRSHLPARMALAREAETIVQGDALLREVLDLKRYAIGLRARARAKGDLRAEVPAQREVREAVTLLARLIGELPDAAAITINVIASVEFQRAATIMLGILEPYPQLRAQIAAAFEAEADAEVGGADA